MIDTTQHGRRETPAQTALNEMQKIEVRGFGGAFALEFRGQRTDPIAYDATAATVESALEALSDIGANNVQVSNKTTTGNVITYDVQFQNALAAQDVEQLVGDASGLQGAGVLVTEQTAGDGSTKEVQKVLVGASRGTFTLQFGGDTTVPIPFDASLGDLQTELNNLASITTAGGVVVSGTVGDYTVTFNNNGARTLLVEDGAGLSRGLTATAAPGVDARVAAFANAQSLGALLSAILKELGTPSPDSDATPTYDSVNQELTYPLDWTHTIEGLADLPFDAPDQVQLPLGVLTDVVTSDQLAIGGTLEFDFVFGVDLARRAPFTLAPPLPLGGAPGIAAPSSGQLSEDLTFKLVINNDFENPIAVTVAASDTTSNSGVGDLVQDFQSAVDAAITSGAAKALGFDYFSGGTAASTLTAPRDPRAFSFVDVFSSASVNTGNNQIGFASAHGFDNGEEVIYNGGLNPVGGLTNEESYFVVVVDATTIHLATSRPLARLAAEALAAGDPVTPFVINLTSAGMGTGHTLRQNVAFGLSLNGGTPTPVVLLAETTLTNTTLSNLRDDLRAALALKDQVFDASMSSVVSTSNNTLSFSPFHRYVTGDRVVYRISDVEGDPGAAAIGGLVDGETYFVVARSATDIQLAESLPVAIRAANEPVSNSLVVDLTALGTGAQHSIRSPDSLARHVLVDTNSTKLEFSVVGEVQNLVINNANGGVFNLSVDGGTTYGTADLDDAESAAKRQDRTGQSAEHQVHKHHRHCR